MPILEDLKALDLQRASVNLWTLKGPTGPAAGDPRYSGHWIETTDDVDSALREAIVSDLRRTEELIDYSLLAQNHEASGLHAPIDETHAGILLTAVAHELPARKAKNLKHLENSTFYLAKFVIDTHVIYAVSKTSSAWRTKHALAFRNVFFVDKVLTIDNRPHFELNRRFDFIIYNGNLVILNKSHFESVLRHKAAQREEFLALQTEIEFINLFVDVSPLVTHVGDNKIQLRRACAIRSKGHYRDQNFIQRLRDTQAEYGLNINFDNGGRILVTPDTCSQIMTALLDHRLKSGFSALIYDVQDTTPVAI